MAKYFKLLGLLITLISCTGTTDRIEVAMEVFVDDVLNGYLTPDHPQLAIKGDSLVPDLVVETLIHFGGIPCNLTDCENENGVSYIDGTGHIVTVPMDSTCSDYLYCCEVVEVYKNVSAQVGEWVQGGSEVTGYLWTGDIKNIRLELDHGLDLDTTGISQWMRDHVNEIGGYHE